MLNTIRKTKRVSPRRIVLYGTPGIGKCFAKGTEILMHDGTVKAVEDVGIGDEVMGPDSNPRRVENVCNGREEMFEIRPRKGESHVVNYSHKISVSFNGEIKTMTIQEYFESSDYVKERSKLWRTGVDFPSQDRQPLDPYFLGIWLGDGHSSCTRVTTSDKEVVECLHAVASQFNGHRLTTVANAGAAKTYSIAPPANGGRKKNELHEMLHQLEVINNKHIPQCFKTSSREERLQLLAGLIDADGYFINGCYEIVQKREDLANDIAFVARSLGLAAYIKLVEKTCTNNGVTGEYFRLHISGAIEKIPCRVERRIATKGKSTKNRLVTGFTVIPQGEGEYFGFGVNGDHLFLLADFTVTHNSTFAAMSPKPIFIQTEDGLNEIDAEAFPICESLADFYQFAGALTNEKHDYQTVAIDSADWLEKLIERHICNDAQKDTIADLGFGKGFKRLAVEWEEILKNLKRLGTQRNMHIILIAHSKVERFECPINGGYDRYSLNLDKRTAPLLKEWATEVLFASYKTYVTKEETGFGQERTRAIGSGERIMHTAERPTHMAKCRLKLPEPMALDFREFEKYLQAPEKVKPKAKTKPEAKLDHGEAVAEMEDVF